MSVDKYKESIEIFNSFNKTIKYKKIENEIIENFFKLCPNVPPTILASSVRETLENFKRLNNIYKKNN